MVGQLKAARLDFRHYLERSGSSMAEWARRHQVTPVAVHRLFNPNPKYRMRSRSLEKQIALHMGYPTFHDFISSYPTGGRS